MTAYQRKRIQILFQFVASGFLATTADKLPPQEVAPARQPISWRAGESLARPISTSDASTRGGSRGIDKKGKKRRFARPSANLGTTMTMPTPTAAATHCQVKA